MEMTGALFVPFLLDELKEQVHEYRCTHTKKKKTPTDGEVRASGTGFLRLDNDDGVVRLID